MLSLKTLNVNLKRLSGKFCHINELGAPFPNLYSVQNRRVGANGDGQQGKGGKRRHRMTPLSTSYRAAATSIRQFLFKEMQLEPNNTC